ncbi:hypothetical protein KIK06_07955 [Nocardiopsis sp. EMB25]|uniref:hypothetical protein n=1 Tax=Nocardiopsis TaxID=2013 RepID=UPI001268849F|nr:MULTISPECIES: hypothetical protein [Nocardiopsis]MCY9783822.1 hypothetical protein [Nocardiopsis sp. EMB25]
MAGALLWGAPTAASAQTWEETLLRCTAQALDDNDIDLDATKVGQLLVVAQDVFAEHGQTQQSLDVFQERVRTLFDAWGLSDKYTAVKLDVASCMSE